MTTILFETTSKVEALEMMVAFRAAGQSCKLIVQKWTYTRPGRGGLGVGVNYLVKG